MKRSVQFVMAAIAIAFIAIGSTSCKRVYRDETIFCVENRMNHGITVYCTPKDGYNQQEIKVEIPASTTKEIFQVLDERVLPSEEFLDAYITILAEDGTQVGMRDPKDDDNWVYEQKLRHFDHEVWYTQHVYTLTHGADITVKSDE